MVNLEPWVLSILADPITKQPAKIDDYNKNQGVLDARIFLKNTQGYSDWLEGQDEYLKNVLVRNKKDTVESYKAQFKHDQPIYNHFDLKGRIHDLGGGAGKIREFCPHDVDFISTDPWLLAPELATSTNHKKVYACLNQPLNFIAATAEFQPFIADSFYWVHIRSVLDHVQIQDLAMLEAYRVLKPGGKVLIAQYVRGGKTGTSSADQRVKDLIKGGLKTLGIGRYKDHHVWHPTYRDLIKLITDSGFQVEDTYWLLQSEWAGQYAWAPKRSNMVCYISARKPC